MLSLSDWADILSVSQTTLIAELDRGPRVSVATARGQVLTYATADRARTYLSAPEAAV